MKLDGFGFRWFSEDYRSALSALRDETKPAYAYDYVCQSQRVTDDEITNPKCVLGGDPSAKPKAILWGDSNAAHYVGMLGAFARESHFAFRNLQVGTCPPIKADPKDFTATRRVDDCRNSQAALFQTISDYPVVVVSANWTYYQEHSSKFLDEFFKVATDLAQQDKLVIIIGKIPTIQTYDRRCREKAISFPLAECNKAAVPMDQSIADINKQLQSFARNTANVEYYEINDYLCPNGTCSAFENDAPLYYDKSHLTLEASWKVGAKILEKDGLPHPFTLISSWQPD